MVFTSTHDNWYNVIGQNLEELLGDVVATNAILKAQEKLVLLAYDLFTRSACAVAEFIRTLPTCSAATTTENIDGYMIFERIYVAESTLGAYI